ncbi:hypothetical protein C8J57DRAFT_1227200 [Mycena rebaudengoi]|nr:hypothetical protein C8J57DRAFT_1227200 [Mycena rebaudengoi]
MRGVGIHFRSSLRRAFKLPSLASQPCGRDRNQHPGPCSASDQLFHGGAIFDCMFITAYCNSIGNSTIAPNDTISRCFNNPAVGSSRCALAANQGERIMTYAASFSRRHIYRSEYGNNSRSPQRFQLRLHAGYSVCSVPSAMADNMAWQMMFPRHGYLLSTTKCGVVQLVCDIPALHFCIWIPGVHKAPLPLLFCAFGHGVQGKLRQNDQQTNWEPSARNRCGQTKVGLKCALSTTIVGFHRYLSGVVMRFCELEHGWKYCAGFVSQLASATASYAHDDPVFDVYTSTHRQHDAASDLGLLLQRLYAYAYSTFQ